MGDDHDDWMAGLGVNISALRQSLTDSTTQTTSSSDTPGADDTSTASVTSGSGPSSTDPAPPLQSGTDQLGGVSGASTLGTGAPTDDPTVKPGEETAGAAAGVGLALGALAIIQSQVNATQGRLTYVSDMITYPKDVPTNYSKKEQRLEIIHFFSSGVALDNDTTFAVFGQTGEMLFNQKDPNDPDPDHKIALPIIANVYIDMVSTTSYSHSSLSFSAKAYPTPLGDPKSPIIRFVCSGRFDPAGLGDCNYRFNLDVDKWFTITCHDAEITSGEAKKIEASTNKFSLEV